MRFEAVDEDGGEMTSFRTDEENSENLANVVGEEPRVRETREFDDGDEEAGDSLTLALLSDVVDEEVADVATLELATL